MKKEATAIVRFRQRWNNQTMRANKGYRTNTVPLIKNQTKIQQARIRPRRTKIKQTMQQARLRPRQTKIKQKMQQDPRDPRNLGDTRGSRDQRDSEDPRDPGDSGDSGTRDTPKQHIQEWKIGLQEWKRGHCEDPREPRDPITKQKCKSKPTS